MARQLRELAAFAEFLSSFLQHLHWADLKIAYKKAPVIQMFSSGL